MWSLGLSFCGPWFDYFWFFMGRERMEDVGFLDFWLLGIGYGVPVRRGVLWGRRIGGGFIARRMLEASSISS